MTSNKTLVPDSEGYYNLVLSWFDVVHEESKHFLRVRSAGVMYGRETLLNAIHRLKDNGVPIPVCVDKKLSSSFITDEDKVTEVKTGKIKVVGEIDPESLVYFPGTDGTYNIAGRVRFNDDVDSIALAILTSGNVKFAIRADVNSDKTVSSIFGWDIIPKHLELASNNVNIR